MKRHVRHSIFTVVLILPLFASAQIDCPAFGRTQNYERWEILLNMNTVEPYSTLDNLRFTEANEYSLGATKNTGIAPGITLKYYVDNITVLRLKAIYTSRNITDHFETFDTSLQEHTVTDIKYRQTLFKIAPGFQWTYFLERFSIFGGFEVPYTYRGDFTQDFNVVDTNYLSNINSKTTARTTVPGGYSVGLGLFFGSTFYYKDLLGIGFEISDAYEYSKLGGNIVSESHTDYSDGTTADVLQVHPETLEQFKFAPFMASLQLSFRF